MGFGIAARASGLGVSASGRGKTDGLIDGKHHCFGGKCQVLFGALWDDFSYFFQGMMKGSRFMGWRYTV